MKLCIDCQFHARKAVQLPPGHPAGTAMMVDLCTHDECRMPVVGEQVPCEMARRENVFCGFQAKYFKLKEVKPEPPEGTKNVIQLA